MFGLVRVKKDLKTLKVISTCLLMLVFLIQIQNLVSSSNRAPSSHVKFDTQNNQFIQERWVKVVDWVIFRRNIPTHWENGILEILMSGCFRGEKCTPISLDRKTAQHLGMWKTACFWNRAFLYLGGRAIAHSQFTPLLFPPLLPNPLKNKMKWSVKVEGGWESQPLTMWRKTAPLSTDAL